MIGRASEIIHNVHCETIIAVEVDGSKYHYLKLSELKLLQNFINWLTFFIHYRTLVSAAYLLPLHKYKYIYI